MLLQLNYRPRIGCRATEPVLSRRGVGIEEGVADDATSWRGCSLSVRPCRTAEESPGVRCCATEPVLSRRGVGIEEGVADDATSWRGCSLSVRPCRTAEESPGVRCCATEPVLSRRGVSIEKGVADHASRRRIRSSSVATLPHRRGRVQVFVAVQPSQFLSRGGVGIERRRHRSRNWLEGLFPGA